MPRQPGSNRAPGRTYSLFERNYRRLEEIIGRPLPDLQSGVVYRLRALHDLEADQTIRSKPGLALGE